jgi:2,4-dienoyl-CoA reductase-like NADH-dependent reductase (Old Yellow Enzyme family)
MGTAFTPYAFAGLKLSNRFIRSATLEGMGAPDGTPLPALRLLYENLARGGVALISTGSCAPDRSWVPNPEGRLSLDREETLPVWEDTFRAIHRGGALVSIQLSPFFLWNGKRIGPFSHMPEIHPLLPAEIEQIVLSYGKAAARARKAGADAVQIHAGHGFPLGQFLSPYFNRREDEYGGSPLNRARIFMEIRRAIGGTAGADFPVWIKMNSLDGISGGMKIEDAEPYGQILSQAGYAAIEVTGGTRMPGGFCTASGPVQQEDWFEGYFLEQASRIKAHTDLPVAAVGGIRRLEMAEQVLSRGMSDLIALSRPFICEANLVNRWQSGDWHPSACNSCNQCRAGVQRGKGLLCVKKEEKIN